MIPATWHSSSQRPPHRQAAVLSPPSPSSSFSESAKATSTSPSRPTSTDLAAPETEKRARSSTAASSTSSAPHLKPSAAADRSIGNSNSNSRTSHQLLCLRSADEKSRLSLWDVDGSLWVPPPFSSPHQQAAAIVSPTPPMRTARTAPAVSSAFAAAVNDDDPGASAAPSSPLSVSVSPSLSSSAAAVSGPSAMLLPGSAMVVTDDYHSTATTGSSTSSSFSWQKLSLDRAVAPLLRTPVAPFVSRNNERKRALLNATYYSECFLHSIGPKDADTAALDAQSRYEKWWVGSTYRGATAAASAAGAASTIAPHQVDAPDRGGESNKRRRVSSVQPAVSESSRSSNSTPSQSGPCTIPAHVLSGDDVDFLLMDPHATLPSQRWSVDRLKAALVEDLRQTGGDVTTPAFVDCLDQLHAHYKASGIDDRWGPATPPPPASSSTRVDGTWIALSKPTFTECLGRNDRGLYLYTLGRLSFDMFRPTSLKCSLRGVFNTISLPAESGEDDDDDEPKPEGSTKGGPVSRNNPRPPTHPGRMARSLQERYGRSGAPVRNYDIVVAFTIEAHQTRRGEVTAPDGPDPSSSATSPSAAASTASSNTPYRVRRPIRGLLTNHGYVIPDPTVPNRLSIWFSGGTLECHQDEDLEDWRELFYHGDLPRRDLGELARVLAAKVLLGATSAEGMSEEDGSMSYSLRRPIGGHGQVFCDVLYGDDDLRILRGHHGTVYVHRRVPNDDGATT